MNLSRGELGEVEGLYLMYQQQQQQEQELEQALKVEKVLLAVLVTVHLVVARSVHVSDLKVRRVAHLVRHHWPGQNVHWVLANRPWQRREMWYVVRSECWFCVGD